VTSLETLKTPFALDIKLFEESVSMDIGTEGSEQERAAPFRGKTVRHKKE